MKSKLLSEADGVRLFALVLDPGEEAFSGIRAFAANEGIKGASVSAIGAFEKAVVGWFDFASKDYRRIPVDAQCEVLSMLGDIGQDGDGKASVHLHAVLGLSDGSTRGGHFLEGIVHPTLEVMVTETPEHLCRKKRPELGIALLDLAEG
jgi:predicted DNA-binding protein with PD1-like motif